MDIQKKINILSNTRLPNFSEYLKVANLTSKKDFLMKGLADITPIKNKLNLNVTDNDSSNASVEDEEDQSYVIPEVNCNKRETSSDSEDSCNENETSKVNKYKPQEGKESFVTNKKQRREEISDTESSGDEGLQERIEENVKNNSHNSSLHVNECKENKLGHNSSDSDSDNIKFSTPLSSSLLERSEGESEDLKLIENYVSSCNLKQISQKSNDIISTDASNCEIYLAQFPKSINPAVFVGESIDLSGGETKIKNEHGKYVLNFEKVQQDLSMLLSSTKNGDSSVKTIKPLGIITAYHVLKSKNKSSRLNAEEDDFTAAVPYPNNLKVRHPIFGSDYKKRIKLNESVQKRLHEAVEGFNDGKKGNKRKSSMSEKQNDINNDPNDLINSLFDEHASKWKKKKSKETDGIDALANLFKENSRNNEFAEKDRSKLKKRKKRLLQEDMFDADLSPIKQTNLPHLKHIANSTMISNHDNTNALDFEDDFSQITVVVNGGATKEKKKKKKSKKHKEHDSTLEQIEMDDGHAEETIEDVKKSKKKKKKHDL